jgi:hypothetical protein
MEGGLHNPFGLYRVEKKAWRAGDLCVFYDTDTCSWRCLRHLGSKPNQAQAPSPQMSLEEA